MTYTAKTTINAILLVRNLQAMFALFSFKINFLPKCRDVEEETKKNLVDVDKQRYAVSMPP